MNALLDAVLMSLAADALGVAGLALLLFGVAGMASVQARAERAWRDRMRMVRSKSGRASRRRHA